MNIFKTLGHYIYLAQWFARARFFGRRAPLQTVLRQFNTATVTTFLT